MYYLVLLVLGVGVSERGKYFSGCSSFSSIILFFIWPSHTANGILAPWPGIRTVDPALKTGSLSLYIAREVPSLALLSMHAISPFAKIKWNNLHSLSALLIVSAGWKMYETAAVVFCPRHQGRDMSKEKNTFNTWELDHRALVPMWPELWRFCPAQLASWTQFQFQSVQSLSRIRLFATPWIAARQASLSITNSRSSLRLTSTESVMPSSHLILCCPLLLLHPIPPSIRVFSNESSLCMRWPKY